MVPIFEIESSTPDKNIERPRITPIDPRMKFLNKMPGTPTKRLRINTKMTIDTTALVLSFTFSKNMGFSFIF